MPGGGIQQQQAAGSGGGGKKANNKGPGTTKRKTADEQRRIGCPVLLESGCRVGEMVDPTNPCDAVKMICQNPKCEYSPYIHRRCYDEWEDLLVTVMATTSWSRSWTDSQRRSNLWDKKGYQLIGKMCRCLCDKGHVRRDLDYKPPVTEDPTGKKKLKKVPGGNKNLPVLKNPDFKAGFIGKQLPNVSGASAVNVSATSATTTAPSNYYVIRKPKQKTCQPLESRISIKRECDLPDVESDLFGVQCDQSGVQCDQSGVRSHSVSSGFEEESVGSLTASEHDAPGNDEVMATRYLMSQRMPNPNTESECREWMDSGMGYWQPELQSDYINRLQFYESGSTNQYVSPPLPVSFVCQLWQSAQQQSLSQQQQLQAQSQSQMPAWFCREYQLFNGPNFEDIFRREMPNLYEGTSRRFEPTDVYCEQYVTSSSGFIFAERSSVI